MIILKAEVHNWGLSCTGDWDTITWSVNDDGAFTRIKTYIGMDETDESDGVFSAEAFTELKNLISMPWEKTHRDGCDGVGWQFESANQSTEIGYVYGCAVLERITKLLPRNAETV